MRSLPIESAVVRELRREKCRSRVQLSRQLALAPSTIGIHVDRLLAGGYLREAKKVETRSGRPPVGLELNPEAGQFIGVDLDARKIRCVSVDFAQRLLQEETELIRSSDDVDKVLGRLTGAIEAVRAKDRTLLGIGLAMPGTIDHQRGRGLHYQYIRGWKDVPLVDHFQDQFGVPVSLENNIRTMALAERWFGQARHVDNVICIGIRSGIGSGVILQGELHRGSGGGFAGEIGGWPVVGEHHPAERYPTEHGPTEHGPTEHGPTEHGPTPLQTLEQVASLQAVLNRLTAAVQAGQSTMLDRSLSTASATITVEAMVAAADAQDPLVISVLREAATEVARAMVQIVLLVDPDCLIVCGPLAALNQAFMRPLREVAEQFLPLAQTMPPIVASELGDLVGALGAAALPAHQWQPEANP